MEEIQCNPMDWVLFHCFTRIVTEINRSFGLAYEANLCKSVRCPGFGGALSSELACRHLTNPNHCFPDLTCAWHCPNHSTVQDVVRGHALLHPDFWRFLTFLFKSTEHIMNHKTCPGMSRVTSVVQVRPTHCPVLNVKIASLGCSP